MARQTSSLNELSFGSDASIDAYTDKSICLWLYLVGTWGNNSPIVAKSSGSVGATGWRVQSITAGGNTGSLRFTEDYAVTDGVWTTPDNSLPAGEPVHIAITQASGATPTIYINGVSQALTTTAPVGARGTDAAATLWLGRDDFGAGQAVIVQSFVYDDVVFTAAEVNRHRWWGIAPGGVGTQDVLHPIWTEATSNLGDATATMVPGGDDFVTELQRVTRPGMMLGVGW